MFWEDGDHIVTLMCSDLPLGLQTHRRAWKVARRRGVVSRQAQAGGGGQQGHPMSHPALSLGPPDTRPQHRERQACVTEPPTETQALIWSRGGGPGSAVGPQRGCSSLRQVVWGTATVTFRSLAWPHVTPREPLGEFSSCFTLESDGVLVVAPGAARPHSTCREKRMFNPRLPPPPRLPWAP